MKENLDHKLPFLQGGGEMGALIRSFDWSLTSLGQPAVWPSDLKQIVGLMLVNPLPMLICWGDDYIQLYNDAFRPINGLSKHPKALGGSAMDTYAEIWQTIGPMFAGVMQGQPIGFPGLMVPLDRNGYTEDCYFDFSYSPIKNEHGQIHGVLVICMEVTEQVQARQTLKEQNEKIASANEEMSAANEELSVTNEELFEAKSQLEELYRELSLSENKIRAQQIRLEHFFMQAPAGICVLDGPGLTFELINPLYQQLFPGRELLGKPLLEALPELKRSPTINILLDVYQTGKTFESRGVLVPLARTNDSPTEDRYFDFTYQARLNAENIVDGILVFVIEVTENVLINQLLEHSRSELRHAEQMLRFAIDAANIGTYSMDTTSRKVYASSRLKDLLGFEQTKEMSFEDVLMQATDEYRGLLNDAIETAIQGGKEFTLEYQIQRGFDKDIRWVRNTGKIHQFTTGKIFLSGALVDITIQKEQESVLRESAEQHARLASIVSSSDDTILSKTLQGIITSWNASAERMFGYTAEETIGKHISLIIPSSRLKEEEFIIGQISQGLKVDHFETVRVAKDGRMIPISLTVSPITNERGEIIGASKIARDISVQKEAQETAKHLYEQVKLLNDKKDEFIGLASHELKTPLTSMNGYLQILSKKNMDADSKRFVDKAVRQLKKLTALVDDLLDVSKIEAGKLQFNMESFDLNLLVRDVIELMHYSTNKFIISFESQSAICQITADSQRIEQVLINLLTNAIKFSPGANRVEVSLSCSETIATVAIKDYGLGIPADKLNQIFSRFYRVDNAGSNVSGLGIGLYLSQEIINRHNGKLWAESDQGKGSIFYLSLPVSGLQNEA